MDGYYIVKNEDFVYNPRISTSAPVGPINRNKLGRTGVMSPLYTVFRPHDVDTTYLEHFFKCAYWHSFMNFNGDSGARSDRFSIKDDVFFQMPIPLPYIDEQRKIGELLTRLDHLITLHQRQPFLHSTPEISLTVQLIHPFYTSSWEQRKVGDFLTESRVRGNTGLDAKKLTVKLWGKGVVEKNDFGGSEHTQYFTRRKGQFIYSKLDFLNSAFGVIPEKLDNYETTADLPAFDLNGMNPYFMYFVAIQESFYLKRGSIADGSRKAKRIHADTFLNMPVMVPKIDEQNLIVDFLQHLDHLITLHQRKGKAAVTGCSNDANNSKGVYCKARDFGYKCCKKVESP